MVMGLSRFFRDERGISLTEGLIAFPIVLLLISTFIEGGVAVYQFNQTSKSVAVGARLLAVSDPLISLQPILTSFGSLPAGSAVPNAATSVSCNQATCNTAGFNRLLRGSTAGCDPVAETGVQGMCDVNPAIDARGLQVTYILSGLGYVGRPNNPVVTVRVDLSGQTFNFFFLGALLGLNNLEIPRQTVTITSEDLSSTPL